MLKHRTGGNLILQSSNVGPALFVTGKNTVGVQTVQVNPLVALDVAGAVHLGADNTGSRVTNLVGRTFYPSLPTYRQLAVFYASNNAGNGALLIIRGACGSWTGSRAELGMTVSSVGGVNGSAQWLGGVAAGVDVQVYTSGGVASVWVVVNAAYAMYNFDVVYGGQGYTQLATAETSAAPSGTLAFSAAATPTSVSNASTVACASLTANTANLGLLNAGGATTSTYPISLATPTGSWTQVCTISDPQTAGTYMVRVNLVQSRGYNALLKSYNIPMQYNYLPTTWVRCLPEYSSGPSNGNDIALDVSSISANSSVLMRVVRTATGSFPTTGLTAVVTVASDVGYPITLAASIVTGTGATNAGLYVGSPVGVTQGQVGVLTENPQYPLDVNASMRVGGTIVANALTLQALTGNAANIT
ncbi:MAG: hypothetical protein EOO40_09170, partial [Deltaproteobacteria bacterium]